MTFNLLTFNFQLDRSGFRQKLEIAQDQLVRGLARLDFGEIADLGHGALAVGPLLQQRAVLVEAAARLVA